MRRLVVSDFHLDPDDPGRYQSAIDALSRCPCDQLILAGDVFEAWIGDDGTTELDAQFLDFCGAHSQDTVFIHGNRDFLISPKLLSRHNIRLIDCIATKELIVIHGDELCTLDQAYQNFKKEVREPSWIAAFLQKPLAERQAIAKSLRQASRETQANRADAIGDAVDSEVSQLLQEYGCNLLIHGHTHRPGIHQQFAGLRAVTSDWGHSGIGVLIETKDHQQNVSLCRLSPDQFELLEHWSYALGTPEWKRNS